MKRISTVKELIISAGFAALLFVSAIIAAFAIYPIVLIPGLTTLAMLIVYSYMFTIGLLVVRKTGAATIILPIVGILAPSGVGILLGVTILIPGIVAVELLLIMTNYRKAAYILATPLFILVVVPFWLFVLLKMGFPLADVTRKYIWPILLIGLIEAFIGGYLAHLTYEKKLKNLKVVRQLQG